MRKLIYTTIILLFIVSLFAEFDFQYAPQNGNANTFEAPDIWSDFGMRKVAEPYTKWHKGVDFAQPYGTHLLTIDGGTINEVYLNRTDWKYKVLKIDGNEMDYGFGHIFHDGEPNDSTGMVLAGMTLKRMNASHTQKFVIIYNKTAIGEIDGVPVTDLIYFGQLLATVCGS